jgi:penicillin-binding protein 1B
VRGVLDPMARRSTATTRRPRPRRKATRSPRAWSRTALQHTVTGGTARPLLADGLGRLQAAGKTGTSNDSRDSWFAGYTGDHLAVVWVGNDQNQPTGLYGATGAMRVWSGIFSRLPSAPLQVGDKGLDWQWVVGSNSTDADARVRVASRSSPGFQPPLRLRRAETDPFPAAAPAGDEAQERRAGATGSASAIVTRSANKQQPAPQPAPPPQPPSPPADDQ